MEFRLTLTGTRDLLMHSSRLADPRDPATKELKGITGKLKKTDDDYEQLARLEHAAGMYHDADLGPYIPGMNIERCIYDSAKMSSQGPRVLQGLVITSPVNPLVYRGPRDIEGLWVDENFRYYKSVVIKKNRVMRCRPLFREWKLEALGELDTELMSFDTLSKIVVRAGARVGLGDYRPRFGRFSAKTDAL